MVADRKDGRPTRQPVASMASMPRLAAAQARQSPSTPRLAATATPGSASSPPRPPLAISSKSVHRAKSSKDISTPAQAIISPNVTPRSSMRRSRADSVHSTPTKTPEGEPRNVRPISMYNFSSKKEARPPSRGAVLDQTSKLDRERRRSSTSSFSTAAFMAARSPPTSASSPNQPNGQSTGSATSFFYANDAPSVSTSPRPGLQKKTSSFFYANGKQEPSSTAPKAPKLQSAASSQRPTSPSPGSAKVFDRNTGTKSSGSPESKSSAFPFAFHTQSPVLFRSPSPPKDNFHLSYRKGASQIIRPKIPQSSSQPTLIEDIDQIDSDHPRRLSSLELEGRGQSPARASSVASTDSGVPLRSARLDSATTFPPKTPISPLREGLTASPDRAASPMLIGARGSDEQPNLEYDDSVTSPTAHAATDGTAQLLKDLAANARRERKLLDLEISNTSLLAINRSLEREVRKQKIDLRRMRRLSRATTSRSSWLSDGSAVSVNPLDDFADEFDNALPDLLEEDYESDCSSDLESIDEGAMSPGALAESDARHRKSDARRLRLDLAKHKELLIDSQKMNQSIKRCLGWTEQLIKDGNKALEYQVNVNDLRIGGKVLSPEEVEQRNESYFPLNQDDMETSFDDGWRPLATARHAGSDATDKDSGVDLDFNHRTSEGSEPYRSSLLSEILT